MDSHAETKLPAVFAGMALFLLWGLVLISGEIPHEWLQRYTVLERLYTIFFIIPMGIFPISMCIGWIKGFPRWSYPYVVHMITFSFYMGNGSTPGFKLFGYPIFGGELWGWRAWVPLMVIALIALAVTRSFQPIVKFFTNIRDDWTLLTFGMFGFMPLLVTIGFDEMDRLFSLYFMVILTVVMSGAAWFYMRADTHRGRVAALLAGILLSIGITVIAPTLFWLKNGWVNATGMAILGGIVVLVMFLPSLIGLGKRRQAS